MSTTIAAEPADNAASGVSLYRAIWLWHFFAGLLVIPFMLNLAITGSLYLFKDEINGTVFGSRYNVEPTGKPLSPQRIADIAAGAVPESRPSSYKDPVSPESSAIVTVLAEGGSTLVFVPHCPEVCPMILFEVADWLIYAAKLPSEDGDYHMSHTMSLLLIGADGRLKGLIPYRTDREEALAKIRNILLKHSGGA